MRPLTLACTLTLLAIAPAVASALAPHAGSGLADAACALVGDPGAGARALVADACTGRVRPGAALYSPLGRCTMSWVADGSDGHAYVTTAGHCARVGDRVSTPGVGEFGTMVARAADGPGADWGWIRVDAEKAHLVLADLCRWGGPVEDEPATSAGPVLQYGWGSKWQDADVTRARVLVAAGLASTAPGAVAGDANPALVTLLGPAAGGDSGSPLMSADGAPMGTLTHGLGARGDLRPSPVPSYLWPVPANPMFTALYGMRFEEAVNEGERALGVTLTLRTGGPVTPLAG